jgi:membrane fusion protein (multidrug efflux system)
MADYLKLSGRKSFTYNNESLLSDITLSLADGSVYPFKGKYSYTKSAVADTEGTIIIVVTFPNPNYLLKSGQFARLSANVGEYRRQTIVPASAVRQIQGVSSVWVIGADSVAEYRQVTVLGSDGKSIALTGGNSGESVALDGNVKLTNGQKVNSVL